MLDKPKGDDLVQTAWHDAARYAPEVSWPILDAIAGTQRGNLDRGIVDAIKDAAAKLKTPAETALLYSDLVCALNGLDWLPFVTGVLASQLLFPSNPEVTGG